MTKKQNREKVRIYWHHIAKYGAYDAAIIATLRLYSTGGVVFMTKKKLAELVGVTQAGIRPILKRLEAENKIVCGSGEFQVLDEDISKQECKPLYAYLLPMINIRKVMFILYLFRQIIADKRDDEYVLRRTVLSDQTMIPVRTLNMYIKDMCDFMSVRLRENAAEYHRSVLVVTDDFIKRMGVFRYLFCGDTKADPLYLTSSFEDGVIKACFRDKYQCDCFDQDFAFAIKNNHESVEPAKSEVQKWGAGDQRTYNPKWPQYRDSVVDFLDEVVGYNWPDYQVENFNLDKFVDKLIDIIHYKTLKRYPHLNSTYVNENLADGLCFNMFKADVKEVVAEVKGEAEQSGHKFGVHYFLGQKFFEIYQKHHLR